MWVETQTATDVGENIRGALDTIGENSGYINQGFARLRGPKVDE